MYIKIGNTSYTRPKALSFSPQTDVTAATLPINEFTADIISTDDIAIGQAVELFDDRDNRWAKYWLERADRVDESTVRVVGKAPLILMQQSSLPSKMYSNADASDVVQEIVLALYSSVGSGNYTLAQSLRDVKINGYCPEQTPRERLQWVCYVLGAYVRTYFNNKIAIQPISDTPTMIPLEKTFWKPKVTYNDYVTSVKGYAFAFTAGTPGTTDEWVEDETGGATYIVTRTGIMLEDRSVPEGARENIVELSDVTLVNSSNAGSVMANVANYQFSRAVVDMDVIDNGEYIPGMLVQFYVDESTMMQGYIQSCAFKFGNQARASLHIIGCSQVTVAMLSIKYKFGNRTIDKKTIALPVGYEYTIENPWFDTTIEGHRYILRPLAAEVTGTMAAGGATATVNYEAALDLYEGNLHVISVDNVTEETDEITIGVIA